MRGGVFDISKRHSKANNKYLPSYDPEKLTKYVTYLNKNNFYNISVFVLTNSSTWNIVLPYLSQLLHDQVFPQIYQKSHLLLPLVLFLNWYHFYGLKQVCAVI